LLPLKKAKPIVAAAPSRFTIGKKLAPHNLKTQTKAHSHEINAITPLEMGP
jgi:hypothetical protein